MENEKNTKETEDFRFAVSLLGSGEASARVAGIYSLYTLAVESEKYRRQVAEILCSHIRCKTEVPLYKEVHANHPSSEIRTAIDLLFRNTDEAQGLYSQFRDLPPVDLSRAHLAGASFVHANLRNADFGSADCRGVNFFEADFQNANFMNAHCQEAMFWNADCRGASFSHAHLQLAVLSEARCQSADFSHANCQGTNFQATNCQETNFFSAQCQGGNFKRVCCQKANLFGAHYQGANFTDAYLQLANFNDAHLQGAIFSEAGCQGAGFSEARCQGASFEGANFEGACAHGFSLSDRIGEETSLEEMVVSGEIDDEALAAIETAKEFLPRSWCEHMQHIAEEHKGRPIAYGCPVGIVVGVLEDTPETRRAIEHVAYNGY